MSLFSGILSSIVGAVEVAAGALLELTPGGQFIGTLLIIGGAATLAGGAYALVVGDPPIKGVATATRNSIAPWEVLYGDNRTGGTLVYMNTWGDKDQMLDMVFVVAAHPCESIDTVFFDQQRVQIDTTAIPTTKLAGHSIPTPEAGSGTSFTPLNGGSTQYTISTIARNLQGVVTVTLVKDIPLLQAGDEIVIQNVSTDTTLNGRFHVTQIISRISGSLKFTYLNGGSVVSISSQGQAVTVWPDYGRNVYVEFLTGGQTLGQTFVGMTAGTPWQGTGNLATPASPVNANGTPAPNQWTTFCSLLGKTAVFIRLHFDTNNTPSKYFPSGIPQISFQVKGKKDIFDPRTGTTGYTTNAALCVADFLSNTTWGFGAAYSTEIPDAQLIAAANTCDESVALGIGGTEPRYACNGKFNLQMRRAEVLQDLLSSCAGRLTYIDGQYLINPAQWTTPLTPNVDLQAIASGGMKWKPTCSISGLYNGVKGTYISPENLWQSTDFPYYAQDVQHGYSSDANLTADGDRRWLEIHLPFTISYATAQRLAKIEMLRRRHYGTGTFQCNMAGYLFTPLDVIQAQSSYFGWTSGVPKTLEITATRLRSEKSGEGWILGTELDVQETDSSIYDWSTSEELSPQGYVQGYWPQSSAVETAPYQWSPGYVAPLSGDAYPGAASFGVQPVYGTDASGAGTINLNIKGTPPINTISTIEAPQTTFTSTGTGGSLPPGDYVICLTARDAGSPPYGVSKYEDYVFATIPSAGSGKITFSIIWGSGDDGGDIYMAKWHDQNGYVFHYQSTITSTSTTSATISTFDESTPGGPDPMFDHFGVVWLQAVHTGPWAQQVQAVTATTITIAGPTSPTMTTNQWAGYNLSLLAKFDGTVEIPILNIPIASSTASAMDGSFVLTIGPNALSDTLPDLTTLLVLGDLLTVNFNATFTDNSFTDPNIANAFFPTGASGVVEAGHVVVVLDGADAGDVVAISSIDMTGTIFGLATNWAITPSTGDRIVVCQPSNVPEVLSAPITTSTALTGTMVSPNVLNLADEVWLFRVRTEDVNDNHGDDALAPWRLVYFFGSPGTISDTALVVASTP